MKLKEFYKKLTSNDYFKLGFAVGVIAMVVVDICILIVVGTISG